MKFEKETIFSNQFWLGLDNFELQNTGICQSPQRQLLPVNTSGVYSRDSGPGRGMQSRPTQQPLGDPHRRAAKANGRALPKWGFQRRYPLRSPIASKHLGRLFRGSGPLAVACEAALRSGYSAIRGEMGVALQGKCSIAQPRAISVVECLCGIIPVV